MKEWRCWLRESSQILPLPGRAKPRVTNMSHLDTEEIRSTLEALQLLSLSLSLSLYVCIVYYLFSIFAPHSHSLHCRACVCVCVA